MTEGLADLLVELLRLPCTTGNEGPIADMLAARYTQRGEPLQRVANSLVIGDLDDPRPRVLLVGHTDVVPPTDADREPRWDGQRIVGRGASDMKAGLAVAMDCFEDPAVRGGAYGLVLVAYAGEEGPHEGNELRAVLETVPALCAAALAVVLEPTDLEVHLGCMGTLQAQAVFTGQAAHSARPWHGRNALTAAGAFLAELDGRVPRDVVIDGLTFREVVTATQGWTSNARNVVPATFTVNLNHRFAPDTDEGRAEEHLRGLVGDRAAVTVIDRAPAAAPRRDVAELERFVAVADTAVGPKQAWTDVARFAQAGVPALNYGPGLTAQAHQAGEFVPVANLHRARDVLARFCATA